MTWSDKLAQLQIIWRRDENDAAGSGPRRHRCALLAGQRRTDQRTSARSRRRKPARHPAPDRARRHPRAVHDLPDAARTGCELRPFRGGGGCARLGGRGPLGRRHLDLLADGRRHPRPPLGPRGRGVRRGLLPRFRVRAPRRCGHIRATTSRPTTRSRRASSISSRMARPKRGATTTRPTSRSDVCARRYLEPFRAGVAAGAASVMAAFNSLNGTPMHAHRRLLTDVLTGRVRLRRSRRGRCRRRRPAGRPRRRERRASMRCGCRCPPGWTSSWAGPSSPSTACR